MKCPVRRVLEIVTTYPVTLEPADSPHLVLKLDVEALSTDNECDECNLV